MKKKKYENEYTFDNYHSILANSYGVKKGKKEMKYWDDLVVRDKCRPEDIITVLETVSGIIYGESIHPCVFSLKEEHVPELLCKVFNKLNSSSTRLTGFPVLGSIAMENFFEELNSRKDPSLPVYKAVFYRADQIKKGCVSGIYLTLAEYAKSENDGSLPAAAYAIPHGTQKEIQESNRSEEVQAETEYVSNEEIAETLEKMFVFGSRIGLHRRQLNSIPVFDMNSFFEFLYPGQIRKGSVVSLLWDKFGVRESHTIHLKYPGKPKTQCLFYVYPKPETVNDYPQFFPSEFYPPIEPEKPELAAAAAQQEIVPENGSQEEFISAVESVITDIPFEQKRETEPAKEEATAEEESAATVLPAEHPEEKKAKPVSEKKKKTKEKSLKKNVKTEKEKPEKLVKFLKKNFEFGTHRESPLSDDLFRVPSEDMKTAVRRGLETGIPGPVFAEALAELGCEKRTSVNHPARPGQKNIACIYGARPKKNAIRMYPDLFDNDFYRRKKNRD